jgi:hypothetical protein
MIQTQEKNLILRFLQLNYPTNRIKQNMRFKRTIILDTGEIFYLNDKNAVNKLYHKLFEILIIVFYSNDETIQHSLQNFLNLK